VTINSKKMNAKTFKNRSRAEVREFSRANIKHPQLRKMQREEAEEAFALELSGRFTLGLEFEEGGDIIESLIKMLEGRN
jgi:hypothetical protein